ncbi:MAG: hypothetical protein P0Y66_06650 [Candidatus Kaistia colombiensis]|nr:MAG: hypothetical protein P0Y66_06650 [Kaistia sp.]
MLSKTISKAAFGLAFLLAAATLSSVQAAEPTDDNKMNGAWEDLAETEGNLLSNAQFSQLTHLAYQTAAVRVCDSHTLDKEAVGNALDKILTGAADQKLTDAQQEERTAAILIAFGARYGLFIAEGHADKGRFCESAIKLKESPGGLPVFLK